MKKDNLSDAHEKARRAFRLYHSAIHCFLIMLFNKHECDDVPDLNEELRYLDDELSKASPELFPHIRYQLHSKILKEGIGGVRKGTITYDHLREFIFYLVSRIVQDLPPLRRVDWRLTWDGTRLIYPEEIENKFVEKKPTTWNNLFEFSDRDFLTQVVTAGKKINRYFTAEEDSATNPGLITFEEIEKECDHSDYFGVPPDLLDSMLWGWDYLKKTTTMPSKILKELSKEYLRATDEWAHVRFRCDKWKDDNEGAPKADPTENSVRDRLEESSNKLYDEIAKLIFSNEDLFYEKGHPHDLVALRLPSPERHSSLDEWHKACVEDGGPVDRLEKRVEVAVIHENSGYQSSLTEKTGGRLARGASEQGDVQTNNVKSESPIIWLTARQMATLIDPDYWQSIKGMWDNRRRAFKDVKKRPSQEHKQALEYDAFAFFELAKEKTIINGEDYNTAYHKLLDMQLDMQEEEQ